MSKCVCLQSFQPLYQLTCYEMWHERYIHCRPTSFLSYSLVEYCNGVTSTYRILMALGSNIGRLRPPI
jgi:hypothetical protein